MPLLRRILPLVVLFSLSGYVKAAPPAPGDALDGEWRAEFGKGKIDEFVFDFDCEGGKLSGEVQRGSEGSEPIREGTC